MNEFREIFLSIWDVFAAKGFQEKEVLAVLLVLVFFETLLLLLLVLRRGKHSVHLEPVEARLDHLGAKLAEVEDQLGRIESLTMAHSVQPSTPTGSTQVIGEKKSPVERSSQPERASDPVKAGAAQGVEGSSRDAAPRAGIFAGLKKTRDALKNKLAQVFSGGKAVTAETLEELEELLISSDLGVKATTRLLDGLAQEAKARGPLSGDDARNILKSKVQSLLSNDAPAEINIRSHQTTPVVILVVGVNGVGKTTTIGKLARRFVDDGLKVTLAACDTFRAAAVEQIRVWGERSGVEVVSGDEGAKPTTVLFQAFEKVKARGDDVLIVDTAGRLHTRVNLMNELGSIVAMIERLCPGAPHEALLVVDATTGQNALEQAREFGKKVKLSGLIVTKLDGTPKGGIVVAIREELGIPIRYIGVGEAVSDLRVFRAEEFVEALFDEQPQAYRGEDKAPLSVELH